MLDFNYLSSDALSDGTPFTLTAAFVQTNYSVVISNKQIILEHEYDKPVGSVKIISADSYSVSINNVSRSATFNSYCPVACISNDEYSSKFAGISISSPVTMSFIFFVKSVVTLSGSKAIIACTFSKDTENTKSYNINASITFSGVFY